MHYFGKEEGFGVQMDTSILDIIWPCDSSFNHLSIANKQTEQFYIDAATSFPPVFASSLVSQSLGDDISLSQIKNSNDASELTRSAARTNSIRSSVKSTRSGSGSYDEVDYGTKRQKIEESRYRLNGPSSKQQEEQQQEYESNNQDEKMEENNCKQQSQSQSFSYEQQKNDITNESENNMNNTSTCVCYDASGQKCKKSSYQQLPFCKKCLIAFKKIGINDSGKLKARDPILSGLRKDVVFKQGSEIFNFNNLRCSNTYLKKTFNTDDKSICELKTIQLLTELIQKTKNPSQSSTIANVSFDNSSSRLIALRDIKNNENFIL